MASESTSKIIQEKAKAGYPAIYLLSSEYLRALHEIKDATQELSRTLYIWTLSKGIIRDGSDKVFEETDGPANALDKMNPVAGPTAKDKGIVEKSIVVMPLMHHFLEDPGIQAKIIDLVQTYKATKRMLIIVTPALKLPIEIEKEFALIEMKLPDKDDLKSVLDGIIEGSKVKGDDRPSEAVEKQLIEASLGLTTSEAENAFALTFVRNKANDKKKNLWYPGVVLEEKCATLKKTGLITFYPPGQQGLKQIGGMANLKDWVSKRKQAFTEKAKLFGLSAPKGILTVGPPGAGKSLGAKAISEELGLPLLRCDMGAIFAGLVGASEANARKVINTAEAVAPCVLWLDELEKGFAGSGSGNLDSGVGSRVLGTFLTYMAEKTTPVFVYATANNVAMLPPELLRKGRFDETFSVMLPNDEERAEIFVIHLTKRGREKLLKDIKMADLVKSSDGYSGAEIEAAINEAMFTAFSNNRELISIDIITALQETQPLSVMMKDQIEAMERWCKGRTRSANAVKTVSMHKPSTGARAVEA